MAAIEVLAERGDVELAFCWSPCAPALLRARRWPARRRSPARRSSASPSSIAIENEIRGRSADERRVVRQESSRPSWSNSNLGCASKLELISQKTKLAEAIRYALSRWEGLARFLDDGRIEIDTNVVERCHPPHRPESQECTVRRLRRRWRALGGHRLADRDLQAQRRRAARLPRRRHHQDRQRPSQQPHRRPAALGLCRTSQTQGRGLKTTLTEDLWPSSVKPHPEEPVRGEEPKLTRALPPQDGQLMSQGDELKLQ